MKLRIGDAFGMALRDCVDGADVVEIIESRCGHIWTNGSVESYLAPYAEWPQFERLAFDHVRGAVLDVGCGAGRHSLHAQHTLKLETAAIDISPLAVRVAGERGVHDARVLGLDDVLQLEKQSFDTVLLLGCMLGGLFDGTCETTRRKFDRLTQITTVDGRIIGSSVDPLGIEQSVLRVVRRDRQGSCSHGYIPLRVRHRNLATPWVRYHYLAPTEVERRLAGTGWEITALYGGASEGTGEYAVVIEKVRS